MKYDLDEEIRVLSYLNPPLSRWMLPLSNLFLSLFSHHGEKIMLRSIDGGSFTSRLIKGGGKRLILYFHGGAFIYKAASYHYRLALDYAFSTESDVLLVDYRLSPENKYPKAVEDALSAYLWALEKEGVEEIALMGDSAGASVAVSLMIEIIERSLPSPRFLMLIYPVVTPSATESKKIYFDTPVWNSRKNEKMWSYYLGDIPFLSPFDFPHPELFPPTYIETAEFDALSGEGILFGEFLERSGVEVDTERVPGVPHGYDMIGRAGIVKRMMIRRIDYICRNFRLTELKNK